MSLADLREEREAGLGPLHGLLPVALEELEGRQEQLDVACPVAAETRVLEKSLAAEQQLAGLVALAGLQRPHRAPHQHPARHRRVAGLLGERFELAREPERFLFVAALGGDDLERSQRHAYAALVAELAIQPERFLGILARAREIALQAAQPSDRGKRAGAQSGRLAAPGSRGLVRGARDPPQETRSPTADTGRRA